MFGFFGIIDVVFPMMFLLFFLMFIFVLAFNIAKSVKTYMKNKNAPRLNVRATIVTKRASTHHSTVHNGPRVGVDSYSETSYYATFEFESGDRLELCVPKSEYGYLVEGDVGELTFQGTRFLSFIREV